jgi:hypothetical protein
VGSCLSAKQPSCRTCSSARCRARRHQCWQRPWRRSPAPRRRGSCRSCRHRRCPAAWAGRRIDPCRVLPVALLMIRLPAARLSRRERMDLKHWSSPGVERRGGNRGLLEKWAARHGRQATIEVLRATRCDYGGAAAVSRARDSCPVAARGRSSIPRLRRARQRGQCRGGSSIARVEMASPHSGHSVR